MRNRIIAFLLLAIALITGTLLAETPPARPKIVASAVPATTAPVNASYQAARGKPWPHDESDMVPDPAAVWDRLDNGLRFVILPHSQAPGRASLRLYLDVGSMMTGQRTCPLAIQSLSNSSVPLSHQSP